MDLEKNTPDAIDKMDVDSSSSINWDNPSIKKYSLKLICESDAEKEELASVDLKFAWEKKSDSIIGLNEAASSIINGKQGDGRDLGDRIMRELDYDDEISQAIASEQAIVFNIEPITVPVLYIGIDSKKYSKHFPEYRELIGKGEFKLLYKEKGEENVYRPFFSSVDWLFEKDANSNDYKHDKFLGEIDDALVSHAQTSTALSSGWHILQILYELRINGSSNAPFIRYHPLSWHESKCEDPAVYSARLYDEAVNKVNALFVSDLQVLHACLNVIAQYKGAVVKGQPFSLYKAMEDNIVAAAQEWHKDGRKRNLEQCFKNAIKFTAQEHLPLCGGMKRNLTSGNDFVNFLFWSIDRSDYVEEVVESLGRPLFFEFLHKQELERLYLHIESKLMDYFVVPHAELQQRRTHLYGLRIERTYASPEGPLVSLVVQEKQLLVAELKDFIKSEVTKFVTNVCSSRNASMQEDVMMSSTY